MDATNKAHEIYHLLKQRRSIRRFQQKKISREILTSLIDVARLAPSGANIQPLDFIVIDETDCCNRVFETIGWAAYLSPPWFPTPSERPTAYICLVVRKPKTNWFVRDASIAAASICLLAEAYGIGSCILCNIQKEKIKEILLIPEEYAVDSLIALGYKVEHPLKEESVDSIKYWRDSSDVLHVPKRPLSNVLYFNSYQKTN